MSTPWKHDRLFTRLDSQVFCLFLLERIPTSHLRGATDIDRVTHTHTCRYIMMYNRIQHLLVNNPTSKCCEGEQRFSMLFTCPNDLHIKLIIGLAVIFNLMV